MKIKKTTIGEPSFEEMLEQKMAQSGLDKPTRPLKTKEVQLDEPTEEDEKFWEEGQRKTHPNEEVTLTEEEEITRKEALEGHEEDTQLKIAEDNLYAESLKKHEKDLGDLHKLKNASGKKPETGQPDKAREQAMIRSRQTHDKLIRQVREDMIPIRKGRETQEEANTRARKAKEHLERLTDQDNEQRPGETNEEYMARIERKFKGIQ